MAALAVAVVLAGCAFAGCMGAAQVDEVSPRLAHVSVSAGSDLTEASQYVEVRLTFTSKLDAAEGYANDVEVLVNGEPPDMRTVLPSVVVEGADMVVRLVPTEAAAVGGSGTSVYFALYDGLVQVAAKRGDGALVHVRAAGGESNAVLEEAVTFTVPTGVAVKRVEAEAGAAEAGAPRAGAPRAGAPRAGAPRAGAEVGAEVVADDEAGIADIAATSSVTFDVTRFAQLRCCSWFWFSDELPLVMMHNHEFLRDTERTCAERLADTVNDNYGDVLAATCEGARVTVSAKDPSKGPLSVRVAEGVGVNPQEGAAAVFAAGEGRSHE